MSIQVTKRDGTKVPFNADLINQSIERAAYGLVDPISKVMQVATDTRLVVYDGITTEEMDQATINAAVQNIKEDPDYDIIATRILLKTIYKRVLGDYGDPASVKEMQEKHFPVYIRSAVALKRLDPRMETKFDLARLGQALNGEYDELFRYTGLSTVAGLYLIKDEKGHYLETPQIFFMRVAMGLSYNEADPTEWAIRFYNKMARMDYIAGTSTNLGSGTATPALSNCFLLEVHDDMAHIAKSVADVMNISKATGGIGASLTKLRASGSPLKSNNGASSGPTPFAKIMDTAIRAIMRAGKRRGALCFYMENWHLDFPEFLDWKHNAGDDHMRMRTANTAAFISDEFMSRVERGEMWYLFDPAEVPDLNELYGRAFSEAYARYIDKAERGEMQMWKKVPARELYRQMLVSLQGTSHPWQVWKDSINLRALNNNTGTIHMSNLCTEITLPQDKENIAVCNLASLNLAAHVSDKQVNWQKLEETVRMAVRHLDNLIDINVLPIPEAIKSDRENRAVGLGVMGLADVFERIGLAYDSEHAYNFTDRIFEFVSYMAIDESANLARERGSYKNFPGSGWSKGQVPIDTLARVEEERGIPLAVDKTSHHKGLNWDLLREKVRGGVRNATLMAVAPNATIGLVAGTVPGIDGRFAQVFSRNTLSGKYLDLNHNLVKDLQNLGIWDDLKEKIIASQGDISGIEGIPQHVKDIYKTSFTTSPYAYVEVAARAQKWVDQALSRNIYLESRDVDGMIDLYSTAWKKGLKSTYYLHMKPRHTAEQSTVRVNKAEALGKKGFGSLAGLKSVAEAPVVIAASAEPEKPQVTIEEGVPVETKLVEPVAVAAQPDFSPVTSASAPRGFAAVSKPVMQPTLETAVVETPALVAVEEKPAYRVHAPEDPLESLVCLSCQ